MMGSMGNATPVPHFTHGVVAFGYYEYSFATMYQLSYYYNDIPFS